MVPGKLYGKHLTEELRKLAVEAVDITPDGDPITRQQKLARMIWNYALGWSEKLRDADGNLVEKIHPPVAWAMQYLYERMEGRAPNAMPESEAGIKATDKVRELAKQRLNALLGKKPGPPVHVPKPATNV